MTPEAWQRVKSVFDTAITLPPDERANFLDSACGVDASLRAEVESLLVAADTEAFLDIPAFDVHSGLRTALAERYRLERELGRGGMATVFLAHDLKHDRPVALKVLHPELAAVLGAGRFEREIKLAARLQHPHILSVHDSGESAGHLWYTMPFVEGESLRDRLNREKQLPVEDALHIAREVADALDYAHRQNVVHRDVKPENILLSDGHALVADFGIARAVGGSEQPLTEAGIAIGTPAYMSPEQATGERDLDGRSDIYSLGCVLYEMLVGVPPFVGPSKRALLAQHAIDPVPRPSTPRPTVPPGVEHAVLKALAKEPDDRFATALQFSQALAPGHSTVMPKPVVWWPLRSSGRWRTVRAGGFLLGIVLAASALWAALRSHRDTGTGAAATAHVAVLPFENLGDSADDFLAAGMTEAVRGKLVALGVHVTPSASANEYKGITRTFQQIGQELSVPFLLRGTVRLQKDRGGTSHIEVTPQLIQASSGSTEWQHVFDAPLSDVFVVQAEVVERVAHALGLAPSDSAQKQMTEAPTRAPEAYIAYLKGGEVLSIGSSNDPPSLRRAIVYYRRAIALDSGFVEAWAGLSQASSNLFDNTAAAPAIRDEALGAAERAAALAPNRVEGHLAMANYHTHVTHDQARALLELARSRDLAPNNLTVQSVTLNNSAYIEKTLGLWDSAAAHFLRVHTLEPHQFVPLENLAQAQLWLRHYPEARRAADLALALRPADLEMIQSKVMSALAEGDLAGARAVLSTIPKEVDSADVVIYMAKYWELMWVLGDTQQRMLLRMRPDAFDDVRGDWGLALAQTYWLRGEQGKARIYADSARTAFENDLRDEPDDATSHVLYGLALAYLGRKAAAVQEGQRAGALMPIARNAEDGPYMQHQLARIYILVGEPEKALDQLEPLLKIPYYLSPGWLKVDPNFDPLRNNPRFRSLVR